MCQACDVCDLGLQIFMTRAGLPATLALGPWLPFFWTMGRWFNCLLLQDILKGNECTNSRNRRALCEVAHRRDRKFKQY